MPKVSQGEINTDAARLVMETKAHFKELRRQAGYEENWKKAEQIYFAQSADTVFTAGLLYTAVERIVPKMDKSVFPPDGEAFEVRSKNPKNSLAVDDAEAVTMLLRQQTTVGNLRQLLIGAYRLESIYGTVFLKYFWDRREERVMEIDDETGEKRESDEPVAIYDDPFQTLPSIWNIYADPKDEFLEGALIEESAREFSDVWKLRQRKVDGEEIGIFDPKGVEGLRESVLKINPDSDKVESDENIGLADHKYGPHEHKVLLNEYWGPVPKYFFTRSSDDKESGELVDNALIVVGQAGTADVLLRLDKNPFDHKRKPYLRSRYTRVPGRLYGIGIINPITMYLSDAYDVVMHQGIQNRSFNLKRKWVVDKNAGVDPKQLQDINNAVIEAESINALKPIDVTDMTGTIVSHAGLLKANLEEATGATPFLSGIPAGRSLERTAEGVALLTSGGLERFELVITTFEEEMLKPLLVGMWRLNQQFLSAGRDIEITGQRIIRVMPDAIAVSELDLIFVGIREIADKNFKISAINIAMQSPILQLMIQSGQLDAKPLLWHQLHLLGLGFLKNEMDISQESQLEQTPEGEVQLLMQGKKIRIDLNDNHLAFIAAYQQLLQQPQLPENVRANVIEALGQRQIAMAVVAQIQQRESEVTSSNG